MRENLAGVAAGAKAADRDANVKAAMAANFMVSLEKICDDANDETNARGTNAIPSLILLSLPE